MGDTTWVPQRRFRPRRHPCKGERKVWPSRRNRWKSLVRFGPFVQYSHPRASLELLWRCPPCAGESSCLQARLPPWQDVAAEHHAPGVLRPSFMGIVFGVYRNWIWEFGDLKSDSPILWGCIWPNTTRSIQLFFFALDSVVFGTQKR